MCVDRPIYIHFLAEKKYSVHSSLFALALFSMLIPIPNKGGGGFCCGQHKIDHFIFTCTNRQNIHETDLIQLPNLKTSKEYSQNKLFFFLEKNQINRKM